jgi:hypothetical protein
MRDGSGMRAGGTHRTRASSDVTTATDTHAFGDYDGDDYDSTLSDADNDDSDLPKDRDGDYDDRTGGYYDSDDGAVLDYGHAASERQRAAVGDLVRRYYAVAVSDDGAAACSLVVPSVRASAEMFGRRRGTLPFFRGNGCAQVLTRLLAKAGPQLRVYAQSLQVAGVRLRGAGALAVLRFRGHPSRYIQLLRERGVWRMGEVLDRELP